MLEPCQSLLELSNDLISDIEKSLDKVKNRYNNDIYIWNEANKIKNLLFQLNSLTDNLEIWEDLKEIYEYVEKKSESLEQKKKKKKKEILYTIHYNDLYNFYSSKYHSIINIYIDIIYLLYQNKFFEENTAEKFVNVLERKFLGQNGFTTVKIEGLGITDNLLIGQQKPETVSRMAKLVDTRQSEGIFLSCTNLPTVEVIAGLEKKLGKPVFSSNTATLWFMF